MNQQQRTLLVIFVAVVLVLVVAIIAVNLSRRSALPDALTATATASPEPTVELPELHGKTEEEIGAMAIGEEEGDKYISAFDDVVPLGDITPDPNATPEPID